MFSSPKPRLPADEEIAEDRVIKALALIDRHFGDRITLRQVRAFLSVAHHHRRGHELSLSDLSNDVGGIPHRSIMRLGDDGLGFIDVEEHSVDGRRRIVSLNREGERLALQVIQSVMDPLDVARITAKQAAKAARADRL